ncbi:NADH:ubiquinone oxidoreductase [Halocynthiibacter halioticoli]|uniref:NADH:ubiquinone oxidoreductase n=1 Tax=Halocynthiibacter TaxID=1579315 RepID=UPI0037449519
MTKTQESGFFTCANMCWIIGVLLGLAAFLILRGQLGLATIVALIIGVAVAAGVGFALRYYFCFGEQEVTTAEQAASTFEAAPEPVAEQDPVPVAPVTPPMAKEVVPEPIKEETLAPAPAAEKKPRTMKAPRKAGADDLKKLKGVGPKLESTLNELGIWHFDQVAKWGAAEIAWVDERLKFKGRIERDGWVDQAKILAEGGETEFSSRKKG